MGLLDALMGNATEVSSQEIEKNFNGIILDDENIEVGYKVIRDIWLFTSKRLIILNIQGLTGNKKEYHTIPYSSITQFSIETAGTFDLDCELKLYVKGAAAPLKYELKKGVDIIGIQKRLAEHICG